MPVILSNPQQWWQTRREISGTLGLVPTMGNLHEGHAALCRRAKAENEKVVVSIFVNPTQFNDKADFERYQRTLQADTRLLEEAGADYIFNPAAEDIYPDGYQVQVIETGISHELEGKFRPGHFEGVMTVVLKLLNIIQADRAYFGEKDYQQLLLVQKMAQAFFIPTEIIGCETVRAADGLALSSRNGRLDEGQRSAAPELHKFLTLPLSDAEVFKALQAAGFRPEYVESKWGRRLAAAWLGDVRLIDNISLDDVGGEKHAALS